MHFFHSPCSRILSPFTLTRQDSHCTPPSMFSYSTTVCEQHFEKMECLYMCRWMLNWQDYCHSSVFLSISVSYPPFIRLTPSGGRRDATCWPSLVSVGTGIPLCRIKSQIRWVWPVVRIVGPLPQLPQGQSYIQQNQKLGRSQNFEDKKQ